MPGFGIGESVRLGYFATAAGRILCIQIIVLSVASLLALILFNWLVARSVALGGMIVFLPNLYFACKIAWSKPKAVKQMAHVFYMGESIKLLLTAALFYFVTQMPNVLALPLFTGFIVVQVVFWFALLLSDNTGKGNNGN